VGVGGDWGGGWGGEVAASDKWHRPGVGVGLGGRRSRSNAQNTLSAEKEKKPYRAIAKSELESTLAGNTLVHSTIWGHYMNS